jgi:hypothetical protein
VIAGAALWVVAAVWYFVAEGLAAAAVPGYDYVIHFVSGLGAPGVSPRAGLMNAAFIVQGLFFPAASIFVVGTAGARKSLPFLVFAALTGVGNVLVGVIHAGLGSTWHLAGAVLVVAGGSAAILAGTLVLRREIASTTYLLASVVLGATGLLSGTMLAMHALPIGLWERGGVYPILVWQTLTAYVVWRRAGTVRTRVRGASNSTIPAPLPPGKLAVGDGGD